MVDPIVFDVGSITTRVGFASRSAPTAVFETCIGRRPTQPFMRSSYVGQEALAKRAALLQFDYPVEKGIITDFDGMEMILSHAYDVQLNAIPRDHPLMLTESTLNPARNREQTAELLFETFQVPALLVASRQLLSLHSTGRRSGFVLDSGDSMSIAVAVENGCLIRKSIVASELGGRDVSGALSSLLLERVDGFARAQRAFPNLDLVRAIKENLCRFIAIDGFSSEYKLPDGSSIRLPNELLACGGAEILFHVNRERLSLQETVLSCMRKVGEAVAAMNEWGAHVTVTGGNSHLPGLGPRLATALAATAGATTSSSARPFVVEVADSRDGGAWLAGSVLAASSVPVWLDKQSYHEMGSRIVHQSCLL